MPLRIQLLCALTLPRSAMCLCRDVSGLTASLVRQALPFHYHVELPSGLTAASSGTLR